jgi:hypothetical protein
MSGVCHPLSQPPVSSIIDCDAIRPIWPTLCCRDDAMFDPVIDDPSADPISFTDLVGFKRTRGKRRAGDPMLEPDPAYHAERERLAS